LDLEVEVDETRSHGAGRRTTPPDWVLGRCADRIASDAQRWSRILGQSGNADYVSSTGLNCFHPVHTELSEAERVRQSAAGPGDHRGP
jgi:hypothetical protein